MTKQRLTVRTQAAIVRGVLCEPGLRWGRRGQKSPILTLRSSGQRVVAAQQRVLLDRHGRLKSPEGLLELADAGGQSVDLLVQLLRARENQPVTCAVSDVQFQRTGTGTYRFPLPGVRDPVEQHRSQSLGINAAVNDWADAYLRDRWTRTLALCSSRMVAVGAKHVHDRCQPTSTSPRLPHITHLAVASKLESASAPHGMSSRTVHRCRCSERGRTVGTPRRRRGRAPGAFWALARLRGLFRLWPSSDDSASEEMGCGTGGADAIVCGCITEPIRPATIMMPGLPRVQPSSSLAHHHQVFAHLLN